MKNRFIGATLATAVGLSLSGCGGINVWPFGGEKLQERSRVPADATAYQCDAGKRFYVRNLDGGAAVWLILPDRELRLDKVAGARYGNGSTVLEVTGNAATLADGSATTFAGCKAAAAAG